MRIAGIIAEYNPFHRGHAYQIEETRRMTQADCVIAVISGDFVQRGGPAMLSSHTRARLALLGGADLVFEIPSAGSCQSAEHFARAGVELLDGLGCVDILSFGSECGDTALLDRLGKLLDQEPEAYREKLRTALRTGCSFPAARSEALSAYLEEAGRQAAGTAASPPSGEPQPDLFLPPESTAGTVRSVLESPNNILGIEYCKTLHRLGSSMRPFTVRRMGSGYHDTAWDTSLPSAAAIRRALKELPDGLSGLGRHPVLEGLPPEVRAAFIQAVKNEGCLWDEDFSLLLRWTLYSRSRREMTRCGDLSPQLADRIIRCRNSFSTIPGFVSLLKTRELTYTRISRALFHLLLDIQQAPPISYARLLGFRQEASHVLGEIKKKGRLPLITKLADAPGLLDEEGRRTLDENTRIACLYETVRCSKYHRPFSHPYSRPLVII